VKNLLSLFFFVALLASPGLPQSQKDGQKSAGSAQPRSKSFIDRVLEFLSISYTSGAQKGPAGDDLKGQIWVVDLKSNSTHALTPGGNYRTPVFVSGSADVLALLDADVVRVPSKGGDGKKLCSVDGILKLVGAGNFDSNQVLVLLRNPSGSHPRVALLAISICAVTDLPYDPVSSQDLQLIENLEGWSSVAGDKRVFVRRQTMEDISGTQEWTDVFLGRNGQEAFDVSQCEGVNCGQPSISNDGSLLVYVREKSE
jgi:hypothetical protein